MESSRWCTNRVCFRSRRGEFLSRHEAPSDYTRDHSNMRLAARRDDVRDIIAPFAARRAAEFVAASVSASTCRAT